MIQSGSWLDVIDNSGAKKVGCIQILSGYRTRYGRLGALAVVSIKSLRKKRQLVSRVKKGDVVKALLIRCKSFKMKYSGAKVSFFENSVVLLTRQNKFIGSRVFGPIPKFFRGTRYAKLLSLAAGIVV